MKNKIIILDKNISFAKTLCEHLRKNISLSNFLPFNDIKALKEYEKDEKINSIIISSNYNIDLDDFLCKRIIFLTDNKEEDINIQSKTSEEEAKEKLEKLKSIQIYKYQKISDLSKKIDYIIKFDNEKDKVKESKKNIKLVLLYSAFSNISVKNNFQLMAKEFSKNNKTLYLSIKEMDFATNSKNFSNIIYFYKGSELKKEKIETQIDKKGSLFYIQGVSFPDDLSLVTPYDIEEIINTLAIEMEFESIFIDLDTSYIRNQFLMQNAWKIIIPLGNDEVKLQKYNKFKRYIKKNNTINMNIIEEMHVK
ncbi:MAG: hypothetical protein Q4F88_03205 [Eubacteriales bacterium]|nr:hypothetical protein [Eubacteriales bacterium]